MSDDKIIALLKKLKALSDRGVDGEKENASAMLNALMKKHGITLNDIEDDKVRERYIKVPTAKSRFLKQVVASIVGSEFKYHRWGKTEFWFNLTDSQFIELEWKMDFYWTKYEEDLEIFYSAFIQKNQLFAKKTGDSNEDEKETTPEERARLFKLFQMMNGLDKHTPVKRIESTSSC